MITLLIIGIILVVVGAIGILLGWFDGDEEETRNDAALAETEAKQKKIQEEKLMQVASELNVTAPTVEDLEKLHAIVEPVKKVGRPRKTQTTH